MLRDSKGRAYQGLSSDLKKRLDPEGLRVGTWPACVPQRRGRIGNAFFISEEYEPKISIFQEDGTLVFNLPTPAKMVLAKPDQDPANELALNKIGRQPNKGFEGLALDPEAQELWTATQGPLIQDKVSGNGKWCRLIRYNLETGRPEGEFVYPLDSENCGISELLWVKKGNLLVLERDSLAGSQAKVKRVYLVNPESGEDVSNQQSLADARLPIRPMGKNLVLDLLSPQLGLGGDSFPPKWEGMAWGVTIKWEPFLWLVSDNDFNPLQKTWIVAIRLQLP